MSAEPQRESTEEYDGPWCTAAMECVICGHEWVAVYPVVAPALECGGCGYMNPCPPVEGLEEFGLE